MNFSEKLISLRKAKGLSQEELGEKLNVTRQTVSKWELGQTTPEMSKLVEMSKLFDVSLDELTQDSVHENVENNNVDKNHIKRNTIIIILLVLVLLVLVILGVNKLCKNFVGGFFEEFFEIRDSALSQTEGVQDIFGNIIQGSQNLLEQQVGNEDGQDFMNQAMQKGQDLINNSGFNQEVFNTSYEAYNGTKNGILVKNLIDKIVTNNKKEKDKIITVIYQDVSVNEPKEIQSLKTEFDDFTKYEISFEYDENGYIYEAEIMDLN